MKWFVRWLESSRRSIFFKLLSGFLAISLFLVLMTIFSVFIINQLGDDVNDVAASQANLTQANRLLDNVNELVKSLNFMKVNLLEIDRINQTVGSVPFVPPSVDARNSIVNYARYRDGVSTSLAAIKMNSARINPRNDNQLNPANFLQMMNTNFMPLLAQLDSVVEDTRNDKADAAKATWTKVAPNLDTAIDEITNFSNTLQQQVSYVAKDTEQRVKEATQRRSFAQWVLIAVGVMVVFFAIGFGLALTYLFTRPVEKLRQRLLSLADGDLYTELDVANRDQFGELATTFNQSVDRLGGALRQVQNQAVKVSSASAQIAAASRQSAQISADQAGAVAEATVTIEELSFTAQQIAEAATLVAQAAEQALAGASEGQETVKESILGINSLKMQVQEIAHKILALSERSQRVGHIIEQITDIADRTHLLALNAAIESAAAGENGKRFAVVAAEVKKLAERSRNATKEVQSVLSEIQAATNASVMATEQGMKDAERGVGLAHRSGDANQTIIMMVERTAQLSNAISLATQQQRSASEQVVASMRQLATVIQDGAATAKQSSSLAISLDQIASELRLLSNQFKVDPPEPGAGTGSNIFEADGSVQDLQEAGFGGTDWVTPQASPNVNGGDGSGSLPNFRPA